MVFPGEECRCGLPDPEVPWEHIVALVAARSSGRCEARTPDCLTSPPRFMIGLLPHSMHHRRPREMGGSKRVDTNTAANIMSLCGTGTTGCHGWVERHREAAKQRGLLVPQRMDPAIVPVVLASGRRVLLDPFLPSYVTAPDGPYLV